MNSYFTDYFGVSEELVEEYGAFNISLITDLPLFIDPFLLFNSDKSEYQTLHDDIIRYLRFLKTKSEQGGIRPSFAKAWYSFGATQDGDSAKSLPGLLMQTLFTFSRTSAMSKSRKEVIWRNCA
jgi:hypothetical protein